MSVFLRASYLVLITSNCRLITSLAVFHRSLRVGAGVMVYRIAM